MYLIALSAYIKFYDTQNGLRIVDEGESEGGLGWSIFRAFQAEAASIIYLQMKQKGKLLFIGLPPFIHKQAI